MFWVKLVEVFVEPVVFVFFFIVVLTFLYENRIFLPSAFQLLQHLHIQVIKQPVKDYSKTYLG